LGIEVACTETPTHFKMRPLYAAILLAYITYSCWGSLHQREVNPSPYSQDTAIQYVYIADAAYSGTSSVSDWDCASCQRVSGFEIISTFFNESTEIFGFIGFNDSAVPPQVFLVFRGTIPSDLENWIENLHYSHHVDYRNDTSASVHSGFYDAYLSVAPQILEIIEPALRKYSGADLVIIGHSLGGALATIAATEMYFDLQSSSSVPANLIVYTYGSPRVGNIIYAGLYNQLVNTTWRVTHYEDPVPHLPPIWMGFYHNVQEVWYNEENSVYTLCNLSGEDPACSDSVSYESTSISDHLYYLNCTM